MNGLTEFLKALGFPRLAAIIGVTSLVGAGVTVLALKFSAPPMGLLFSDLELEDSARIIEQLRAGDIPFEQKQNGRMIFVPQNQVFDLRMRFAGEGLPRGGVVGYEIFDREQSLGTTTFVQNLNYLRALEGELSRTIGAIDDVDAARVFLVVPKRELFSRETKEPSASITLRTRRGQLTRKQVQAIQYLVASAVQGLSPRSVSIVDEEGRLLASGNGEESMGASGIEDMRTAYETELRNRIEDIITRILGPGNVRAQVTAQMDLTRVVEESMIYDPEGQVLRNSQTTEENSSRNDSKGEQGLTVGNNLPDAAEGNANESSSREATAATREILTYDNSSTKRTRVEEPGRVERLNVAVVVNGTYETGEDGSAAYTPRTQTEMDQITALIRTAMGFNEKRGDQLEVVNLAFARAPNLEPVEETSSLFDFGTFDIVRIAEAIAAIVIAIVALFVLRPMLSRLMNPPKAEEAQAALAQAQAIPQLAPPGQKGAPTVQALPQAPAQGHPQAQPASLPAPQPAPQMPTPANAPVPAPMKFAKSAIDISQVEGHVKESSIKKVGELVNSHPEESLSILRTWLHDAP